MQLNFATGEATCLPLSYDMAPTASPQAKPSFQAAPGPCSALNNTTNTNTMNNTINSSLSATSQWPAMTPMEMTLAGLPNISGSFLPPANGTSSLCSTLSAATTTNAAGNGHSATTTSIVPQTMLQSPMQINMGGSAMNNGISFDAAAAAELLNSSYIVNMTNDNISLCGPNASAAMASTTTSTANTAPATPGLSYASNPNNSTNNNNSSSSTNNNNNSVLWVCVEPPRILQQQQQQQQQANAAAQSGTMNTVFGPVTMLPQGHLSPQQFIQFSNPYPLMTTTTAAAAAAAPETGLFPLTYLAQPGTLPPPPPPPLSHTAAAAAHQSDASGPRSPPMYGAACLPPPHSPPPPPLPYFPGVVLNTTSNSTMSSPLDHTLRSAESCYLARSPNNNNNNTNTTNTTVTANSSHHAASAGLPSYAAPPYDSACAAPLDVCTYAYFSPLAYGGGTVNFYSHPIFDPSKAHHKHLSEEGKPYALNPIPIDTRKTQLIVNFLPQRLTDEEFRALFRQYGELDEEASHIIYDFRHLKPLAERAGAGREADGMAAHAPALVEDAHEASGLHEKTVPVRSKGYGFIYYRDGKSTERAIKELNGMEVYGRKIKVHYAVQQRAQPTTTPAMATAQL